MNVDLLIFWFFLSDNGKYLLRGRLSSRALLGCVRNSAFLAKINENERGNF